MQAPILTSLQKHMGVGGYVIAVKPSGPYRDHVTLKMGVTQAVGQERLKRAIKLTEAECDTQITLGYAAYTNNVYC